MPDVSTARKCWSEPQDALSGDPTVVSCFDFEPRGRIEVKGKGPMYTHFLLGHRRGPTTSPCEPTGEDDPIQGTATGSYVVDTPKSHERGR